jgi:hypothetical protein
MGTRSRTALLWGLLAFLACQAAFAAVLDRRYPELYDAEYGRRLTALRTHQAEAPERPVFLVLGSSRTALAFRPEIVPPLRTPSGAEVLPFNCSHMGAGPLLNLMDLRRLLADGIRPTWLLVEVMPAYFAHDGDNFLMLGAAARDFPLLRRHLPGWRLYGDYLLRRAQLAPRVPAELVRRLAPAWQLVPPAAGDAAVASLGGCPFLEPDVDEPTRRRRTAVLRDHMACCLNPFRITGTADQATRKLLRLCRREGIAVVLLVTPEGSEYRSWYAPDAYAILESYLDGLCAEFGVPLVDARDWLSDADFYDSHHVLERGANCFTRRLAEEVLRPVIAGRPPEPGTACGRQY